MFAATSVTAKRGMQNTNVLTALIVSLLTTTGIVGIAVLFDPPDRIPLGGIALLAAAGLAGDGVGRLSMLTAVDRLGPSIAIPIQTASPRCSMPRSRSPPRKNTASTPQKPYDCHDSTGPSPPYRQNSMVTALTAMATVPATAKVDRLAAWRSDGRGA